MHRISIDPIILIGEDRVIWSKIIATEGSRSRYLSKHHKRPTRILCLCRKDGGGVEMGVSLRQGTYFLRAAHPGDGIRHRIGCPFHQDGTNRSDGTEARPVVTHEGGKTVLNLDLPAYMVDASSSSRETSQVSKSTGPSKTRKTGRLRTILDWLWNDAEINFWSPNFEGRRSYYWLKQRLDKSLADLSINGRGNQPLLVIPPYNQDHKENFLSAIKSFDDALTPVGGKHPVGVLMGMIKEVRPVGRGFAVLLKHSAREYHWLSANQWLMLNKSWFGRLNKNPEQGFDPGERDFFVAIAVTRNQKRDQPGNYWSKVEDFAAIEIADTKTWLPVDSGHERKLALNMVEQGRTFIKPMAIGENADLLPDFILEDTPEKHVIEVLGLMNNPDYVKRVEQKRAMYLKMKQPVIWWIPGGAEDMPDLPSAISQGASPQIW